LKIDSFGALGGDEDFPLKSGFLDVIGGLGEVAPRLGIILPGISNDAGAAEMELRVVLGPHTGTGPIEYVSF
jgi:hypothetical protein